MHACSRKSCDSCSASVVCHCLQITEEMVQSALAALDIRTLKDLRQATGAGDGCTACHHRLRALIERRVALPVVQPAASTAPSPI